MKKPKDEVWYSKVPIGHNTLSKTVGRLCTNAQITGFKTNHSLRVTTATRLFQSGAEEQLIMSHTGHRSIDGVRTYKRESTQQKRSLSEVLNAASNGQAVLYGVEGRKRPRMDVETKEGYLLSKQVKSSALSCAPVPIIPPTSTKRM